MSLDFLSPLGDRSVAPRSPLLEPALAAGGRADVRGGWEVGVAFADPAVEAAACEEAVGFADRSPLTKLELQGAGNASDFEAERALRIDGGWRCRLRPDRELILYEPGAADELHAESAREGARLCDLTPSLAALALAGPLVRETFARFCALDLREGSLPIGGFRPGSVARTPGLVLREGVDRYLMLFGAAHAEYVWQVVADAAGWLGGAPVEADRLPAIVAEVARA